MSADVGDLLENKTVAYPSIFGAEDDLRNNVSASDNLLSLNDSTTLQPENGHYEDHAGDANEILIYIQYGFVPLFLVTGLIGNSLTIVTMTSRHFSHMTSRSVLIFLAISDMVFLVMQPLNRRWVINLFGTDIRALSNASCKAFFVVYRSSKMTSSWLVVLLCFERFVSVVFPLNAKTILRKQAIFPAIALNYIINIIYNSVWSFSTQIVNGSCRPNIPSGKHKIFSIIGSALYSFIPTLLLVIFTPTIIYKLRVQMAKRQAMSDAGPSTSTNKSKTSHTRDNMMRASYMVLGVLVSYILLIIPITLVQLIAIANGSSSSDLTTQSFVVYKEVARMLEQVNYSSNFIFYVLGSNNFRHRALDVICCKGFASRTSRTSIQSSDLLKSKKITTGPTSA